MAGTVFVAPVVDGVPSRTYVSVTNVPIPAGTATALIPVECTVAGLWGNIPSYTISDIQTDDPVLRGAFDFIGNPQGFSNGNTLNVKMLGDSLLIPVDDSWNGDAFYEDLNSFYERFFGADLELGDDGDLTFDGYGDVGSVIGVGNLAQAVRDRLITPKLSLVYHPEYGSILGQIAAEGVTPYTQKWAALAIKETLLADDRVGSVNVVNLDIRGPVLNVVVDVTPVNQGEAVRISAGLANLLAV
jgi:phage baseplate assembly protein W